MFSLVTWRKVPESPIRAMIIGWVLPIALACGQYFTGGFGNHTADESWDICSNHQSNSAAVAYHNIFFYGLLWLIVALLIMMRCRLFYYKWTNDPRMESPMVKVLQQSLEFYPALLLICWVPHSIIHNIPTAPPPLHLFSISLKISNGFLLAIAYFYQSSPGRQIMMSLFRPTFWISRMSASVHLSQLSRWTFHRSTTAANSRKTASGLTRHTEASVASEDGNEMVNGRTTQNPILVDKA